MRYASTRSLLLPLYRTKLAVTLESVSPFTPLRVQSFRKSFLKKSRTPSPHTVGTFPPYRCGMVGLWSTRLSLSNYQRLGRSLPTVRTSRVSVALAPFTKIPLLLSLHAWMRSYGTLVLGYTLVRRVLLASLVRRRPEPTSGALPRLRSQTSGVWNFLASTL